MLLLRFATRTLFGLLFHEPPRRDRLGLWSAPPAKNSTPKNHPPQALRLRVPCVADPALHGGVEILPVQPPPLRGLPQSHETCGQSYGHSRGAVGDDRERRGNPADQYLGYVVEVLWHRPVGHRLKHLERPWSLHLAHPTRSDRRRGRPSVCRRLRPRGHDTS